MLEIKDLSVSYGKNSIVKNISAAFAENKITAVVGPNGCGKTTLLRAAAGLLKYLGSITVEGKPLGDYSRVEAAKKIAYMPQIRHTPDMSVEEYLMCARYPHMGINKSPSAEDKYAVALAMEQTDISEWARRSIKKLSGGERQKVYFAFALAQGTDILLLDEPTTYLDMDRQYELLELMQKSKSGKTIIAVLHDLSHALEYADDIAVMRDGGIAAFGSIDSIVGSGVLEEICNVRISSNPCDGQDTYHITKKRS